LFTIGEKVFWYLLTKEIYNLKHQSIKAYATKANKLHIVRSFHIAIGKCIRRTKLIFERQINDEEYAQTDTGDTKLM